MKHWFTRRKRGLATILVLLFLGIGMAFASGSFWRIIQIGNDMVFFFGSQTEPVQKAIITEDGAFGVGTTPEGNTMLALDDDERALLVNRVGRVEDVPEPVDGLLVYDASLVFNCFRFYQSGAWSECLGVADKIRVSQTAIPDNQGRIGDIYFDDSIDKLVIHDGTRFVAIGQPIVKVGTSFPPGPVMGDLFFNETENKLYVFNGTTWVDVSNDFSSLVSYQKNCTRKVVLQGQRNINCPDNKLMTAIFFEGALGTPIPDNLTPPEVHSIECCEVTFAPYYWETGTWSNCVLPGSATCGEGTQTRTVSCLTATGVSTDPANCIDGDHPAQTRTCIDRPCTSWVTGSWGECAATGGNASEGQQTRNVYCEDGNGRQVPNSQCLGAQPEGTRTCEIPTASNNLGCGPNGWKNWNGHIQPHQNGGTNKSYGAGPMTVDWSICDKHEYVEGGHSKTHTVTFADPPRSGNLKIKIHRQRKNDAVGVWHHWTPGISWTNGAMGKIRKRGIYNIDCVYSKSSDTYSCTRGAATNGARW